MQFHPVHTRHLNVANHTHGLVEGGRLEEFFRRRKSARNEPARPHHPLNSVPHLIIIVDDRDNSGILQLCTLPIQGGAEAPFLSTPFSPLRMATRNGIESP